MAYFLIRGSGEIPNGLGIAQLFPILNASSMRPVVHNTLKRWRESLAAWAAWVSEMYLSIVDLVALGYFYSRFKPKCGTKRYLLSAFLPRPHRW